jgi:Zn finger protein HypA/HybF involved in hydrogenase expression
MYHCENCDGVVSRDFVRVFGTSENRVYRCPECAYMTDIRNGEGVYTAPAVARRDYEATRWARP